MKPTGSAPVLRRVLDRRFRANPAFELVAPDRLPADLRPAAGEVVLVPRDRGPVTAKVLSGQTARLVAGLREPGLLPADARERGDDEVNEAVARLVLDGALEVEDAGRFVSGPRAHAAVFRGARRAAPRGPLGELSLRAIRYGQRLGLADVGALSRRLYGFGSIPRGPRWDRLAGPEDDLAPLLGLGPGGRARDVVDGKFEAVANTAWLAWARPGEDRPALPYKLYVSPRPDALPECIADVLDVFESHGVWSFKAGRGVLGLLRPDKVVAYLESFDALLALAGTLRSRLAGVPAHGVPFTVEASDDGLLSWGMDPPEWERLLDSRPESWRLWVANRLAGGLVFAGAAGGGVEPWEFSLDRLALEGVDPATWLPADTIWPRLEGA